MAAARDEVARRQSTSTGSSPGGGLLGILALLIGITALGAAYFLYEQSRSTHSKAGMVEQRVKALEEQLASTGDELSESDAMVRVRIKELDTEMRKLWDDRKKRLAAAKKRDAAIAKLDKSLDVLGKKHSSTAAQLTALAAQVDELAEILARADLGIIQKKVADAQALSQQVQGKLNQLEKRVSTNEEWVESVNVFRRQVNERLNDIQNPASAAPVLQ